ncbi:MFS transporter [Nocardia vinacea]|uniref:MFS transporter n=1 Tax=Nocardia vinacea TaxID=96468 RepID=UPI00340CC0A4
MPDSPRPRHILALALLAFAQFVIAIDYNIVYVALPDIGHALGFSSQSLQWVVSAYAVGLGGLLLLGGRAVDRFGQRRLFIGGLTLYGTSSLLGGLAVAPGMLIAARAIQGLGGALLTPATLALIATVFPEGAPRNRAMAVWGTAGGAGLAAGSLLGGVLASSLGWQWVFYVNVPLTAVAVLAAPRLLPADPPPSTRDGFDLPGALVATLGACLLVFGLAAGPEAGWTSPRGIGAIGAGAGLLAVFVLIERHTRDPLMPLRLLRIRSLATAMAVMFIFMGTLSGQYYVFTTYLQDVLGFDALHAGLAFLPLTLIAIASTERLVAPLLNRWGLRTTLSVGLLINALGMGAFTIGIAPGGSYLGAGARDHRVGRRLIHLRDDVRGRRVRRPTRPARRRLRTRQHRPADRRRRRPGSPRRHHQHHQRAHDHIWHHHRPTHRRLDSRRSSTVRSRDRRHAQTIGCGYHRRATRTNAAVIGHSPNHRRLVGRAFARTECNATRCAAPRYGRLLKGVGAVRQIPSAPQRGRSDGSTRTACPPAATRWRA